MGNLPVVQPSLGYDADVDVCRLINNTGQALAIGDVVMLDTVTGSVDATTGLFNRVKLQAVPGGAPSINDRISGTALTAIEAIPIGGQGQFAQAGIYPVKVSSGANMAVGARLVMSAATVSLVSSAGDVATGGLKIVGVLMQVFIFATGATQVKLVDFSGRNGHGHGGS